MQNKKASSLCCALVAAVFATATAIAPSVSHAQAPRTAQSASSLVSGTVSTVTGTAAGTFTGVLKLTSFAVQNGQIVANGLLTGTITNLDGTTTAVNQTISTILTGAQASCPILTLTLGPLHLNLLGLVIDLNQVNLNITAVPGAGNLLGNLLCDVANLLNAGGPLQAIVNDLNNILNSL